MIYFYSTCPNDHLLRDFYEKQDEQKMQILHSLYKLLSWIYLGTWILLQIILHLNPENYLNFQFVGFIKFYSFIGAIIIKIFFILFSFFIKKSNLNKIGYCAEGHTEESSLLKFIKLFCLIFLLLISLYFEYFFDWNAFIKSMK
jgi:hypothetical protein